MQEHFAVEQGRAQTTEHVHLHGGFDVPEEQLDRPAPRVELGQFGGGVGDRIEQGGNPLAVLFSFSQIKRKVHLGGKPPRTKAACTAPIANLDPDRKSTRLNSSHLGISYAV